MLSQIKNAEAREANAAVGPVAATAMAPTLPAVANTLNYIAQLRVTGGGATAASVIDVTITGLLGGTITEHVAIPAGTASGVERVVWFDPPLPASGKNVAITLNVPSFGAGNLKASCFLNGFKLAD